MKKFLLCILILNLELFSESIEYIKKLRELGRFDEAIELLQNSDAAEGIEAETLLARLYLDKNSFEEASKIYNRICKVINTHDCYNELAITYISMGDYDKAILELEKAISLNNKSALVYSNLGLSYLVVKKYEKAEEAHKQAIKLSPENPIVKVNYAVYLVNRKKISEAKALLNKVLVENKTLYIAELYMGLAHYLKEEYSSALLHYNKGLLISPECVELLYYRALLYYKKGDYINSMLDLKMIDKLYPEHPKAQELKKLVKSDSKL
jgi:tetratricopeptide (TPR) repeat protein